jgi:Cu-Zn family superoxide dismutase
MFKEWRRWLVVGTVAAAVGLFPAEIQAQKTRASAAMQDSAGRSLGTLMVEEKGQGLSISGHLTGLPAGVHGIHLHAVGRCEPPFQSAGGHWNPTGKQHGFDNPKGPHAGDFRNIKVGSDGSVHVQVMESGGKLSELLDADGAAVIIHAGPDDYRTDPAGNSGARIACGVVQRS